MAQMSTAGTGYFHGAKTGILNNADMSAGQVWRRQFVYMTGQNQGQSQYKK